MDGAPPSTMNAANDYATSAAKELTIREQTAGLVSEELGLPLTVNIRADHGRQIKTTQDIATLIRDLQELWLFGGLDTLQNPADEDTQRKKAEEVASMIEMLAHQKSITRAEGSKDGISAT